LFTVVQILLSALLCFAVWVEYKTAIWLHSMAYADPVRQQWQSKLEHPMTVMWFGVLIPWILHTLFYCTVTIKRMTETKTPSS